MAIDQQASQGDADPSSDGSISASAFPTGPSVQTHSHLRFRRLLMGVSGKVSPSDPDSSESRFRVFLLLRRRKELMFGMSPWLSALMVLSCGKEVVDVVIKEVDDTPAVDLVVGESVRRVPADGCCSTIPLPRLKGPADTGDVSSEPMSE